MRSRKSPDSGAGMTSPPTHQNRLPRISIPDSAQHKSALAPRSRWSRRGFVVTSLATGFALSVQPVSAQTITTDTNGLDVGEVKVKTKDGEIPAYRAMPDKGGPFATVLVVHEVWGVHEHIKDICRRLAKAGYYAIAPELYARQGNAAAIPDTQQILREIVAKVRTIRSCPISTRQLLTRRTRA